MLGRIDPPATNRIVVNVIYLLPKHIVALDRLPVASLLPNLMLTVEVGFLAHEGKLVQLPLAATAFHRPKQLARGMTFEGLHDAAQIGGFGNEVDMIFRDNVGVKPETFFTSAKRKGFNEDVAIGFVDESGDPLHDGARKEIDAFGFDQAVT